MISASHLDRTSKRRDPATDSAMPDHPAHRPSPLRAALCGEDVPYRERDVTIEAHHDRTNCRVVLSASNEERLSVDDGVLRRLPPVGMVLDQEILAEVRNRR